MNPPLFRKCEVAAGLLGLLAGAVALAVLLAFAGCKPPPPVCPANLPPPPCLLSPPPVPAPLTLLGPDKGCPAAFVGCLTVDDGVALDRRLRSSSAWEQEAWMRCGPTPAAKP